MTTIGMIKHQTKEVIAVDGISSNRLIVAGMGINEKLPLLLEEFLIGFVFYHPGFFVRFSTFEKQVKNLGALEIF